MRQNSHVKQNKKCRRNSELVEPVTTPQVNCPTELDDRRSNQNTQCDGYKVVLGFDEIPDSASITWYAVGDTTAIKKIATPCETQFESRYITTKELCYIRQFLRNYLEFCVTVLQ